MMLVIGIKRDNNDDDAGKEWERRRRGRRPAKKGKVRRSRVEAFDDEKERDGSGEEKAAKREMVALLPGAASGITSRYIR
jgi:hypothetical protein